MKADYLIINCNLVTLVGDQNSYGLIEDASIAIENSKIIYAGPSNDCVITSAQKEINATGKLVTPGLIDCHTHLVFAGNRAQEFESRLNGQSYENIAQQGGGIVSTVSATRSASKDELFHQSAKRLERLLEEGVTSVEIKSGYGLDIENEIKILEVARALGEHYPVHVATTFLGAHALPAEFRDKQDYIDFICSDMMPVIAKTGLADAVDVFCEGIGFSTQQCEQIFLKARELGLPIKGHVEQLSDLKGAVLAAQYDALSVDHLEYLLPHDTSQIKGSVAVLLPAAYYCLNETQKPPIAELRKHKIPIAVATDLNPGTAPMASLLTAMHQACVSFGLTPSEALHGVTKNAALALGLQTKGHLAIDYDADLLLWDIEHPAELAYGVNFNRPNMIWHNGILVGGKDFEKNNCERLT